MYIHIMLVVSQNVVRPPLRFCSLLKKSEGNPNLKILDFSKTFLAAAPLMKKVETFVIVLQSAYDTKQNIKLIGIFQSSARNCRAGAATEGGYSFDSID